MHYVVIVAVFLVVGIVLLERPYKVNMECVKRDSDCFAINLHNNLDINAAFSGLTAKDGHVILAIVCEVKNLTDSVKFIDRGDFSVITSDGTKFEARPFKVGHGLKTHEMPDHYEVPAKMEEDYIFVFSTTDQFSKKDCKQIIKKQDFFFLKDGIKKDTLFRLAVHKEN